MLLNFAGPPPNGQVVQFGLSSQSNWRNVKSAMLSPPSDLERSELRLIEHVVELRRPTAERTGRAIWTIVPEQLEKCVVGDVVATESSRGDPGVGSLCWRQRSVSPPLRHERKHVVEEREVRD